MNRIFLDLGFIKIYYYSLFILLGFIIGGIVIYLEIRKENVNFDAFFDMLFNTIICAFIGARTYYVLFNLSYFLTNPIEILCVWNGGLAIHGGILGGFLYLLYYHKKHNINLLKLFDILVIGLIIGQSIGRWGNFFNSEAYGFSTTYAMLKKMYIPDFIIKGMYIDGSYYMPTFFFESVFNFLGFLILLFIRYKFKNIKTGRLTGFYLMWYSFIRFIIESMRMDSLMFGSFKMAQLVSIILFFIGCYLAFIRKTNKLYRKENIYE